MGNHKELAKRVQSCWTSGQTLKRKSLRLKRNFSNFSKEDFCSKLQQRYCLKIPASPGFIFVVCILQAIQTADVSEPVDDGGPSKTLEDNMDNVEPGASTSARSSSRIAAKRKAEFGESSGTSKQSKLAPGKKKNTNIKKKKK